MTCLRPLLCLLALLFPAAAMACGTDSDCPLGDRHYRVYLPPGDMPDRALIFAHGYRGSAKGVMRNTSLLRLADRWNMALIAPKSARDDWALPGAPSGAVAAGDDELAYFDALAADVERRFGIDSHAIAVSGFSAGGMMVWTLACRRGDRFAGFIPYSGTFWEPGLPDACDTAPASLVHIHGTADRTVPLAGRPIQDTRQGDVAEALRMYRAHGGFTPAGTADFDDLACDLAANPQGRVLNFCRFDGGHSFRTRYLDTGLQMLAGAGDF